MSTGPKTGTITITIKATVDGDLIDLGYDVTAKTPKPPRKKDRAWISRGDNVVFEDPKQMSLKGVRGLPTNDQPPIDAGEDKLTVRLWVHAPRRRDAPVFESKVPRNAPVCPPRAIWGAVAAEVRE